MKPISAEIALCPMCGHVLRHRNVDEDTCDECGLTTLALPRPDDIEEPPC